MTDRYKAAYEHYQRQVQKRWTESVIAKDWDDLGGNIQDCWRAGLDAFDGYLDGVSHLERAEKAEARVKHLEWVIRTGGAAYRAERIVLGVPVVDIVEKSELGVLGNAIEQLRSTVVRAERAEARVAELEALARKQAFELGWPCPFCGWDQPECQCKQCTGDSVSNASKGDEG